MNADKKAADALEVLQAENSQLRLRLEEAEETLAAIRSGAIDAVVVQQSGVNSIYTLEGADRPYRLFVEEMHQAAATLHLDGTIGWCNRQLGILLNMPQSKLLGVGFREFVATADLPVYDHLLLQGRTPPGGAQVQLRQSDGALVPTVLNFSALPEDCGSGIGVLVNDLTSQRRHEELTATHLAVRASEDRLRLAHQVARIGTFEWNIETGVNTWDADLEAMYGLPPGGFAATQSAWEQLVHPEDRAETVRRLNEALATSEFVEGEWRTIWPDGSVHWLIGRATVLRDPSGKPVKLFGVNLDITERKRTEEALRSAQAQLEEHARQLETRVAERTGDLQAINKQLEAFVYSIAHDLRAPLRSMQGFSEMLLDLAGSALNEEARDLARRISKSAQFMDALLQDLLAFSRVAQQAIHLTPIRLESVVRTVLSRLEREIEEKTARVDISESMPAVLAHGPTMGQVMFNLLTNALKFVAPGVAPRVRVHSEETAPQAAVAGDGQGFVRVWIEDNGIGIAPEHHQQIFRLFTRLQGNTYSGTGVGLAIVQKGIERMGGRLGVESALGQGSRFWFDLRKA